MPESERLTLSGDTYIAYDFDTFPLTADFHPIAAKYAWHALRHYAISSWLASGIDLKTSQHWAGHATLALTLDTYGHLIPRADDHARIAAAEGLLG